MRISAADLGSLPLPRQVIQWIALHDEALSLELGSYSYEGTRLVSRLNTR